MDEVVLTPEELLSNETKFFEYSEPTRSFPSEQIIASKCCSEYCNLKVTRCDILKCRYLYVKFVNTKGIREKEKARREFILTLKRTTGEDDYVIPLSSFSEIDFCASFLSRVFGTSLSTYLNIMCEERSNRQTCREPYSKTIEYVSKCLHVLANRIQPNSLGQVMVGPQFSKRVLGNKAEPMNFKELRKRVGLNIRQRKHDTLIRCSTCTLLTEKSCSAGTEEEKKEAQQLYQSHLDIIGSQRMIQRAIHLMSQDPEHDVIMLAYDAMSNRVSKLPLMDPRPKIIGDAIRIDLKLTAVQVSIPSGTSEFMNFDYVLLSELFKHDSSYNVSVILDSLTKLPHLPSQLVIVADNCPNNKSYVLLGALGYLLMKLKGLRKIRLLFGQVGHTHNGVDAHFGNVSTALQKLKIMDPLEFTKAVDALPSVTAVTSFPTIYDFAPISQYVHKPTYLLNNNQILIVKDGTGLISWSSAPTMNSLELFQYESETNHFKLFKENMDLSSFHPKIQAPMKNQVETFVANLRNVAGQFFNPDNWDHFQDFIDCYGMQAFGQTVLRINRLPPKIDSSVRNMDLDEQHHTIVEYLKSCSVKPGKVAKKPKVNTSMRIGRV